MDSAAYMTVSRQSSLLREMSSIANNIANVNTTGYKKSGFLFKEVVDRLAAADGEGSVDNDLSEGSVSTQFYSNEQGFLDQTGGVLDLAIDGEGYFLVEGLNGERLTRAGVFMLNNQRMIVNAEGMPLLNAEGEPFEIPIDVTDISISPDGTISTDGNPIGQIVVVDTPPGMIAREGSNLWLPLDGFDPVEGEVRILQGYLEASNVQPILEIARLIEVQRNYEMNQKILDQEDQRVSDVARTMRQG